MVRLAGGWASRRLIAVRSVPASVPVSARDDLAVTVVFSLSLPVALVSFSGYAAGEDSPDRLKDLQTTYVASAEPEDRREPIISGRKGPATSSPTTPAIPTAWCRSMSSARRPTWAPSRARTAGIATRRRSRLSMGSCPRIRSTPAPSTPTRATFTGCRRRRSPGGSSIYSSSGSTAWTGRPRRPRPSSRRARSIPREKARD